MGEKKQPRVSYEIKKQDGVWDLQVTCFESKDITKLIRFINRVDGNAIVSLLPGNQKTTLFFFFKTDTPGDSSRRHSKIRRNLE